MLASVLASDPDFLVRLIISTGRAGRKPYKYKHAVCMPILPKRKFLGRFQSIVLLLIILPMLIRKDRKKRRRIVLFIRNEPVYLLAAALLSGLCDKIIFQNSFPHELFRHGWLKLKIARMLYRISARVVDAVLIVSPEGERRVRQYFPPPRPLLVIPLLSDMVSIGLSPERNSCKSDNNRAVRFIYIGTHAKQRELDFVLKAIVSAMRNGLNAHFMFIGGSQSDIKRLRKVNGVSSLEKQHQIRFLEKMPRSAALAMLAGADVGLSLIPPVELFRELSPTKLAEYMGAGLSVLANRGIPLQEEFMKQSDCGWLVEWDIDAIRHVIIDICVSSNIITDKKRKAIEYARKYLRYENYYPEFKKLLT